ncbi:hypothetical protein ACFPVS_02690 [Neisseria weixii]|uniref:hypothetical protein n=1 Tax=Neisseria weixii TaxID=1853276 RepID=UPI000BB92067|nr:hypothetical protein [Neisseria weixii]ATD64959.1 hypothetical protein CGZ65_05810 [Neisseria weixii]
MRYINEKTLEIRISQDALGKYGCDIVCPSTDELIFGWDPEFDTAEEAVAAAVIRKEVGLTGVPLFADESSAMRRRIEACIFDDRLACKFLREAVLNAVFGQDFDVRGAVHLDNEDWSMFQAIVNDYRVFGLTASLNDLACRIREHFPCYR